MLEYEKKKSAYILLSLLLGVLSRFKSLGITSLTQKFLCWRSVFLYLSNCDLKVQAEGWLWSAFSINWCQMTFLWGTTELRSSHLPSAVFFFNFHCTLFHRRHIYSLSNLFKFQYHFFLFCIVPKLVNGICSKMLNSRNFLSMVVESLLIKERKKGNIQVLLCSHI